MKALRTSLSVLCTARGAVACAIAVGIAAAIATWLAPLPEVVLGLSLTGLVGGMSARFPRLFTKAFGILLGTSLLAYALLGRGFAYFGVPPLYVGEVLLALGVLALFGSGRALVALRTPGLGPLLAYMSLGLLATATHFSEYGVDALRDGVLWGYGVFAIIVASLLERRHGVRIVLKWYARASVVFLILAPLAILTWRIWPHLVPSLPLSGEALLQPKPGDVAVHLVGVLAFFGLGLARTRETFDAGKRVCADGSASSAFTRFSLLGFAWLTGAVLVLTSRAALLTLLTGGLWVLLARGLAGVARVAIVSLVLASILVGFDVRLELRHGRPISASALATSVVSIFNETGENAYDGTRSWRLQWWSEIVGYTLLGDYFWTGKGYGVNLAEADGFVAGGREGAPLRSPHNSHLAVLARGGVPQFVAWAVFNFGFALRMAVGAMRLRSDNRVLLARIHVWALIYWFAFVTNASFDVFLEGPQGGIWYWAVVGVGLAAARLGSRQAGWQQGQERMYTLSTSRRPASHPCD